MTESTINTKIRNSLQLLTEMHGVSEAELYNQLGVSKSTFYRLLSGAVDPRASTLTSIAAYFNVSVDQLLGNQPIVKSNIGEVSRSHESTYIPIFSMDKSEEFSQSPENMKPSGWSKWLEVEPSISRKCFATALVGDSMWPNFTEGALLIADPNIPAEHRKYVICHLHENNEIVFRQYIRDGSEYMLKPVNHAYKTIPFGKGDKILGVVIQTKVNLLE